MKTTNKNLPQDNFVSQLMTRYIPYWPVFIVLLVLTTAGAWTYLYMTKPLFESSARILIKDEKKGSEDSKALEDLNVLSPKKIIENETEVIQSRTLLAEVVVNMSLFTPVFEDRRFKQTSGYITSPVKVQGGASEKNSFSGRIYFTYDEKAKMVVIGNKRYPLNEWTNTDYGRLKFTTNSYYNGDMPSNRLYFRILDPKSVVSALQNNLKVATNSRQSSIINISLRDEVRERSEDVLNSLLNVYSTAMLNDKNLVAANTLSSVESRLKSVERDLDSIEQKAENYKSRRGVVDISEQGKLFLQNVSANDQKLGDVNIGLTVLDQAEQYVKSKNAEGGFVPSTSGVSDPVLSSLIDKLYGLELERESLRKTTGENNPAMVAISDKIDKMRPSILENIQNQRRSLEASGRNIESVNRTYTSMLQTIPEKERDLIEINRELSIKNNIYAFLLQKREETALSHASTVSDSRIIDKAESDIIPVTPKPKVIYVSAFLFALLLGVGSVTVRESMSQRVMFRDEIQALSSAPIIGEISGGISKDPIVIGQNKRTFIAEQFRKLRSSLQFIGVTGTRKRILVTSSISGEGKSFVSLNLAISLSLTGKKVVLLDSDMNNPSLHEKLVVYQQIGLSEFLSEQATEEEIVKQTDLNANLYYISAGKLPDNPAELMMKTRMEELLNILDARFDYIVIDSSPVGLVTDAYIISPFCDATVFVIRHNYTPKSIVEQLDDENEINHMRNIGIVFNDVRSRGFSNNKYGYGYGRGYLYNDSKYYRLNKADN